MLNPNIRICAFFSLILIPSKAPMVHSLGEVVFLGKNLVILLNVLGVRLPKQMC